jgi:trans-2,3-dihydro-3-hydroxyanthranilate isomerase
MRYRVVDVFSDRPLAGNGLCVVLDPCPDPLMQAVAREMNLSETTFPVVTSESSYEVRIFTPAEEMPFAGHPSLGTAWVLGPNTWEQTSAGAVVTVEADADGAVMSQPDPELTEVDADGIADALGLPGIEGAWRSVAGGLTHVLIPTSAPIGRIRPQVDAVAAIARRLGSISLCPFTRVDDKTLHVRAFMPGAGVPEDPGTGSAAGPIALLAREQWGTADDVLIRQGDEMGRACRIEARGVRGDVRVSGRVTACAEGQLLLP